ncbi:MAG: prolipoprotein diacylglyceryl transferase [Anaerolineales bacterium]|nr:prolipoprotein diacylglyceryl transferase [Anaerolineales bacterium]
MSKALAWYHFGMDVAFYLPGRVPVYTFSLLIAIASALGLFWVAKDAPEKKLQAGFSAGIWALFGAAIVGRSAFVAIHWGHFQDHPLEIPQIWLGGMSGSGALAGAILTIMLIAIISKNNLAELSDDLIPLLTAITVSAWLGCWVNGCLYGTEVQAWWGIPARDEWGEIATRWPLQPAGALLTLLIAWGVDQARGRGWLPSPGLAAALEVGCIALTLLWAASFRADPVPQWRNLGLDTWAALGLIVILILTTVWVVCFEQVEKFRK